MNKKDNKKVRKRYRGRTVLGVAWYRRDQWNRLLEIVSDRDQLEDTYDEWQSTARKQFDKLAKPGHPIRKVDIDVEELLLWCDAENRPVDGAARAEFTAAKLREREKIK